MKQYQVNRAYSALGRLANMQLPVRDSRNLYLLSKQLEDTYYFELEQEKKLIKKYGGTLSANGSVTFANSEDANKFGEELSELNNLEVEIVFNPVVILCDAMGDQKISPLDVACLDGFVSFE